MKVKQVSELKAGMWCRLANGVVHVCGEYDCEVHYERGLIDMGAEWYPAIPEGYRLATAEDWEEPKPEGTMATGNYGTSGWYAADVMASWDPSHEYIVPIAKTCETCGREL